MNENIITKEYRSHHEKNVNENDWGFFVDIERDNPFQRKLMRPIEKDNHSSTSSDWSQLALQCTCSISLILYLWCLF